MAHRLWDNLPPLVEPWWVEKERREALQEALNRRGQ